MKKTIIFAISFQSIFGSEDADGQHAPGATKAVDASGANCVVHFEVNEQRIWKNQLFV